MKYVDEFRDKKIARVLSTEIERAATRPWKIMEVCGGQTHTILQFGLEDLLPEGIELLHGPGCPVCVTPLELINKAIAIARHPDVILCSFGDMLRVPGSAGDLLEAKAKGADVRIVYSPLDALKLAIKFPERKVVFFAVGFETTAPANAMAVHQAKRVGIDNFFLLCSHVTVPPAITAILESPTNKVQAFLGPGHVCSVMGSGILCCVKQLEEGMAFVENQYARAVNSSGNLVAQSVLGEVFEVSDRNWRGIGAIPKSGYKLSAAYKQFDAEAEFHVETINSDESPLCISGQILQGLKKPWECSAFGKECTPEHPLGATMVSSEGTCATYYKFGKIEPGIRGEIVE